MVMTGNDPYGQLANHRIRRCEEEALASPPRDDCSRLLFCQVGFWSQSVFLILPC
jgi:hypothetical protein